MNQNDYVTLQLLQTFSSENFENLILVIKVKGHTFGGDSFFRGQSLKFFNPEYILFVEGKKREIHIFE